MVRVADVGAVPRPPSTRLSWGPRAARCPGRGRRFGPQGPRVSAREKRMGPTKFVSGLTKKFCFAPCA
eukprot:3784218-Pyramimonas_sp.AAC.1